jgi:hypothetical protein
LDAERQLSQSQVGEFHTCEICSVYAGDKNNQLALHSIMAYALLSNSEAHGEPMVRHPGPRGKQPCMMICLLPRLGTILTPMSAASGKKSRCTGMPETRRG